MSEISLVKGARSAEADFDVSHDCPTLTIGISDTGAPRGGWIVHIWATFPDGEQYCGAFDIASPPPLGKSRVVGFACFPGAEAFRVRIDRTDKTGDVATARILLARHHDTILPGLQPNGNFATVHVF